MNIAALYQKYTQNYLVDTDTRRIRKNTIFFALKGEKFNGNKFAEEAIKKGALYAVVDELEYKTATNIIWVDNVLETLQKLANYHRNQLAIPIIGLTGSNGKTTTKELIYTVLSKHYNTIATQGNLNNHIGVPLTLLSMTPNTEIGIVEMGANHPQEIALLSAIAAPDYGYITNFGKAHLEGFGSVAGVIKAKSELYDFLRINDKTVFINPEDTKQVAKSKGIRHIFFDKSIQLLTVNPFIKLQFKKTEITSNLIGKYNYHNIAAAITIGQFFLISPKIIKEAIESYVPTNNRSQIIKTHTNTIILDAYNANPSSMEAALQNFDLLPSENKIIILGDMFELGKMSIKEHQNIANLALSLQAKTVFLVGKSFSAIATAAKQFNSFNELKLFLEKKPIQESFILIKGSRGMALERLLTVL